MTPNGLNGWEFPVHKINYRHLHVLCSIDIVVNKLILSDAPAIMSVFAQVNPNVVCDPKALQISHSLKVHRSKITSVINFVELEVYLNHEGFLDDGEGDHITTNLSQVEGAELVLARVKEHGDEGFKDFLWCLEQDSDWHIGHIYAIALLKGDTFTDETQREIECSMKLLQKYRNQLDVIRIIENSLNMYDLIPIEFKGTPAVDRRRDRRIITTKVW